MSNNTSDNKENKIKSKGPSLRIATAGDIPEERLVSVAKKFAEVNEIEDYRLTIEQRDDLIGGFIVYFQGSRYDYSIRGQLNRIGSFIKQTRSFDSAVDGAAIPEEEFPSSKVKEDLEKALEQFPESHKVSIDNLEIASLTEADLEKRIEDAFLFQEQVTLVGPSNSPHVCPIALSNQRGKKPDEMFGEVVNFIAEFWQCDDCLPLLQTHPKTAYGSLTCRY